MLWGRKMKSRLKTALFIIPVVLVFQFFLHVPAHAEEQYQVIFECEDIGVEARRLLENLKEARQQFMEKEEMINKRENELKILQAEVDKKLNRLTRTREEVERLLAQKDEEENEMIRRLGRIYQRRDPASAAITLSEMDKDLVVSILAVMRDKFAGEILDNMAHDKAAIYSTALGRLGR